jgi:hypothetical protein
MYITTPAFKISFVSRFPALRSHHIPITPILILASSPPLALHRLLTMFTPVLSRRNRRCHRFHQPLHPRDNLRLYRCIFHHRFDSSALARRFSLSIDVASHFSQSSRGTLCTALHRSGDVRHPDLQDTLLVAYVMVLNNFSFSFRTRTVPRGRAFLDTTDLPVIGCPSTCHDWDWVHSIADDLSEATLPCYTPGILTGK